MIRREPETTKPPERPISTADIVEKSKDPAIDEPIDSVQASEGKPATLTAEEDALTELLSGDETRQFHERWTSIQTEFVDEPRGTLEKADTLVAEVMTRLAEVFADQRSGLEKQWDQGEQTSTEDLRLALQRYRSFFQRLLSV